MTKNSNKRRNFGKTEKNLPKLDLISVQLESWDWFIKTAIAEELSGITPIDDFTGKNWQLHLDDPSLGLGKTVHSGSRL